MKKTFLILLGLGLAALGLANTTQHGHPGLTGLDRHGARGTAIREAESRGLGDCSASATASPVSYTSTVINPETVSGLDWATSKFPGSLVFTVTNTGSGKLVAWVSRSTSTIAGTAPAGVVIAAGDSDTITAQAYDGIRFHLQGLTASSTANYSVCTN